ncbi:hypothetical protein [Desulfosporosinus sp. BICA1-9]|uniref:hypothetical protein n=1 Tax=Desulfosporosinus sp. BICA1-9 TaxID=1531958 RepID=UPI000AE16826|nr:hypothetical protein [Desulfosporosinus sp. BICA1-9]
MNYIKYKNSKAWQYEQKTMEAWLPCGRLLERWIAARGLTDAAKVVFFINNLRE